MGFQTRLKPTKHTQKSVRTEKRKDRALTIQMTHAFQTSTQSKHTQKHAKPPNHESRAHHETEPDRRRLSGPQGLDTGVRA